MGTQKCLSVIADTIRRHQFHSRIVLTIDSTLLEESNGKTLGGRIIDPTKGYLTQRSKLVPWVIWMDGFKSHLVRNILK